MVFDYGNQSATIGPLSAEHEPGGYDLCLEHSRHLQVPTGWQLTRVAGAVGADTGVSWLADLADEVRRIGWREDEPAQRFDADSYVEVARRGHLRMLADPAGGR